MKVTFLDIDTLGTHIELSSLRNQVQLIEYGYTDSEEDLIATRIADSECVITNKTPISKRILDKCPQLKLVLAAATGIDHIDLKSCTEAQIPVCNARHYTGRSLAQHVFASILYFANHQHLYHQSIIDTTWSQQKLFCLLHHPIMELDHKTLGIIGYGNLGQSVAALAQSFGMNIKVCESLQTNKNTNNTNNSLQRWSFENILTTSDFISLHCPLTQDTHHLFSEQSFQKMKKTAYLINTARGAIVDSRALLKALDEQQIAGAALDVFNQEPLPINHTLLMNRTNLLLTPHNAWGSLESRQRLIGELEKNLRAWIKGSIRNQCLY